MNKVIQIAKLYDSCNKTYFGYVGIDINTRKLKYYSFYDRKGNYQPNKLYEFDARKLRCEALKIHMSYCHYQRPEYSEILPSILLPTTKKIIEEVISYNERQNYPTSYINNNRKDLSIQYKNNIDFFGQEMFGAIYMPVLNILGLPITRSEWKAMSEKEKEETKNHIIHEIGHMKVTRYHLEEKTNILYIAMGFLEQEIPLELRKIQNGDLLYITKKEKEEDKKQRALEEIINDAECTDIFKDYQGIYPHFGKRLNYLCNNQLYKARYDSGLEKYYQELEEIIKGESQATALLEEITESIYGEQREAAEKRAKQLIRRYEIEKNNKKNS